MNTALDTVQIGVLAFIQGFTEFLPISSSGHLVLPSLLLGWQDQGLSFDIAVHLGSLLAVIFYFRQDLSRLIIAWLRSFAGQRNVDVQLAWLLLIATVPAGVVGLLLSDIVALYARALPLIAVASIGFALLLWQADKRGEARLSLRELDLKSAIWIGLAQVLALIPGTSRSGITMTAGLFCNLEREAAARFSFLLSIPIILASGLLLSLDIVQAEASAFDWRVLVYAGLLSGIVAATCIHFFLRLINRVGFLPFVIYRILLGVLLIAVYVNHQIQ